MNIKTSNLKIILYFQVVGIRTVQKPPSLPINTLPHSLYYLLFLLKLHTLYSLRLGICIWYHKIIVTSFCKAIFNPPPLSPDHSPTPAALPEEKTKRPKCLGDLPKCKVPWFLSGKSSLFFKSGVGPCP